MPEEYPETSGAGVPYPATSAPRFDFGGRLISCPECEASFRFFGPYKRRECRNEHVFDEQPDGMLKRITYPEWTPGEIRDAEVELYQTHRIDMVPNRRAALYLLREQHDAEETSR